MSKPGVSPRHFSNESQERIVLRLEGGETIAAVAGGASCSISGTTLTRRWGRPASTASAGRRS